MRLNYDCIRDILLYIEDHTTDEDCFVEADVIKDFFKSKYDSDTLNYHIRQIHQAELVDTVEYSEGSPELISSLSWKGNEYIANIRDNHIWSKAKGSVKGLSSVAFSVLIECAKQEIKKQLSLP